MAYYVGKFVIIEGVKEDADENGWVPDQPALVIGTKLEVTVVTPEKVIRKFTTTEYDPEHFPEGEPVEEEPIYIILWKKDPSWDNWYTVSNQAQTDLETVTKQAEAYLKSYVEGGWADAIVKVVSAKVI